MFFSKDFSIQNFSNKYLVFCVMQDDQDVPLIHEDGGEIGLVSCLCTKQSHNLD